MDKTSLCRDNHIVQILARRALKCAPQSPVGANIAFLRLKYDILLKQEGNL